MRVLIVEDEAKMAGLIRRGLEREGMAVDVAGDGEEAMWKAEAVEYDAIVLDLMLPGIDVWIEIPAPDSGEARFTAVSSAAPTSGPHNHTKEDQ